MKAVLKQIIFNALVEAKNELNAKTATIITLDQEEKLKWGR